MITELLEQIDLLTQKAVSRAIELHFASLKQTPVRFDKIGFDKDEVTVWLQEDTRYDCPDYFPYTLSIQMLDMWELEWQRYLEGVKSENTKRAQEAYNKIKEAELSEKRKQFEKLKQELGE